VTLQPLTLKKPKDRLWLAYLAATAAPILLFFNVGPSAQAFLDVSLAVCACGAVLAGILLHDPRPRRPWLLLAAGPMLAAAGNAVCWLGGVPISANASPPLADLLNLAGYLAVVLGFCLLLIRRPFGTGWAVVLDAGILTCGLALVVWVAFAGPLMTSPGLSAAERASHVVFLVADIGLIALVACLLLGTETGTPAMRLFVLSLAALLVGDGLSTVGGGLTERLTDGAYLLQYSLWGAAALHPSIARRARISVDREHRISPRRLALLTAAALVAPVLLVVQGLAGHAIDYMAISVGWMATVVLVLACVLDLILEQTRAIKGRLSLEARLRETSETLRAILDSSPLSIVVVDRWRNVLFWSRTAERHFGYSALDVVGGLSPIVLRHLPKSERDLIDRVFAGESLVAPELPGLTKDGRTVNMRTHLAPIRDETGRVWGAIALMEDTDELNRLLSELIEARKLESIGRLAGGIAHDFNNILTAIIGYADLCLIEPPGTDTSAYVTGIRDAGERAAGLTQQLLAFSRRQMLNPQVLDANEVVAGVESMLRRLIGEQIELRIELHPAAGCLKADRTQIEQVVMNLALNGRDAMPNGGRLVVRTGRRRYSVASSSKPKQLGLGTYTTIEVSDTGSGMDDETKNHIFEPFFTTKSRGRGTGLGLATTYGIIKQSGGSVVVDSEPDQGTTFRVFFPSTRRSRPPVGVAPRKAGRRTGRILLVEDEPLLRDIAEKVLSRAGFDVIAADGPDEAIAAAEGMAESLDLLLTDVVMPDMRGPELADRLRRDRPSLRVLLVSGYAEEIVEANRDRATKPFLAKPFSAGALLAAVDEALALGETTSSEIDADFPDSAKP